jgi:hypothetical protein
MFKNVDFTSFNYIEIDIFQNIKNDNLNNGNISSEISIIDVNWSKTNFINLLNKLIKSNQFKNPFEKQYRVLKYLELIHVNNITDNKYNLYSLELIENEIINNELLFMKYKKTNLAMFQFPSTNQLNDTFYLNKITFKITNLIYLNFEIMKKNDIEIYYRVYINFNNEKTNIDYTTIKSDLEVSVNKLHTFIKFEL